MSAVFIILFVYLASSPGFLFWVDVEPLPEQIEGLNFKPPARQDTVTDKETSFEYAAGEVLVVTAKSRSPREIENLAGEVVGGNIEIIGGKVELGIFQLEIPGEGTREVDKIISTLEEKDEIKAALPNYTQTMSNSSPQVDQWRVDEDKKRWAQKQINLPEAWSITTGNENLKLGVIDHAYYTAHEDLKYAKYFAIQADNSIGSEVWNALARSYTDHGTSVASVIAARADNNKGMAGVMWDVDLYCYGTYFLTDRIEGILDAAQKELRVVNISLGPVWGRIGKEDKYCEDSRSTREILWAPVIEYAAENKLLIVHAAGNNNKLSADKMPPASLAEDYSNLISVGAVDKNLYGIYAEGSSVTVSAPGRMIWSARTGYGILDRFVSSYEYKSGTSYATPLVSGVAGLMLSVNPEFTPEEIKEIIEETAVLPGDNGDKKWDYNRGSGIVDAYRAVKAAKEAAKNY